MRLKHIATLALVASMGFVATTAAPVMADSHAAMTAEDALTARKAIMRAQGGTMRTLAGLSTVDEMVGAANIYVDAYAVMADMFPEGSDIEGSKALPTIWEDWEGFEAVIAKGATVAAAMLVAAEAGDQAAFGAAAQGLGPVCGQCHSTYRIAQ